MAWQGPCQSIGATLAGQSLGLDERSHALLEKERVTLRLRDQQLLERMQGGVGPKERAEELVGGLRW